MSTFVVMRLASLPRFSPDGDRQLFMRVSGGFPAALRQVVPRQQFTQQAGQRGCVAFGVDMALKLPISSEIAPLSPPTMTLPQAMASGITRPYCSFHLGVLREGSTTMSAAFMKPGTSSCFASRYYRSYSPSSAISVFSSRGRRGIVAEVIDQKLPGQVLHRRQRLQQ